MADLFSRIHAAAGHISADWNPARASEVLGQMRKTHKRRQVRKVVGGSLALLLICAGAWVVSRRQHLPTQIGQEPQIAQQSDGQVRLGDGSLARVLDEQSHLELITTGPDKVLIRLRGAASFQVAKNPQRLYRVETERVAVEVLGTRFIVKEQPDHRVHVAVSEGRVRVLWDKHQTELAAGTSGDFPRPLIAPTGLAQAEPAPIQADEPGIMPPQHRPLTVLSQRAPRGTSQAKVAPPLPTPTVEPWQSLAEQGKFEQAYQQILSQSAMADFLRRGSIDAAELLLLADVARFSGHPSDAVPPLRQLLRDSPKDPRAPLASFTLGRILLDDLGQPREAAQSFRHVEDLEAEGPLTQDALAREVEAWSRAGEQGVAHSRAEEYVRRYPTGRRLRSVRRYGDLD